MRLRPNTWDSKIVDSVLIRNEYALPNSMRGKIVVDIGAHIGSFAVACAKRGASKIYCFEPDPENFELLAANTSKSEIPENVSIALFDAAVVPATDEDFTLAVRRLTNHDFGTRNTGHVDVFGTADDGTVGITLKSILEQIGDIDLLKIDCEGMEWALLEDADLSKVKVIEMELHDVSGVDHVFTAPYKSVGFLSLCQSMSAKLRKEGFEVALVGESMETAKISAIRETTVRVNGAKPKVLWIGDAAVTTGYGRVTENVCTRLHDFGWDVHVLGIGYNGDPHKFPYKIYPAVDPNKGGHPNGLSRLKEIVNRVKPDIIAIQDDSWNVGIITEHMAMNNIWAPTIGYVAVDAENVLPAVATQLRNLKHVICHTEFGSKQLKLAGYNGPISVAGHGVDSDLYNIYNRKEAREGIATGSKNINDAFIWGVVAANQPRKRLDLSIAYFAAWWSAAGKPDNAYLFIHTNNGEYDLKQLADYCGIRGRLLGTDGGQSLPDNYLPSLYNAFDAMIHTSEGESWGLTMLEGMACGIPQIAVETGGAPSWAGEAVSWVKPSYYQFTPRIGTKRGIASENDFVSAMIEMYSSEDQRRVYSERGRAVALKLKWDDLAIHVAQQLRKILDARKVASQTETDCLAEFA